MKSTPALHGLRCPNDTRFAFRAVVLVAVLCWSPTASVAQSRPGLSRGTDRLQTTLSDCKNRAKQTFELEGYVITREMPDAYMAIKGPYTVVIICGQRSPSDVDFNVVVASDGGYIDDERDRLGARMIRPTVDGTGGRSTPPGPTGGGGTPAPTGAGTSPTGPQGGGGTSTTSSGAGSVNLAYLRPARQSSIYEDPSRKPDDAQRGNDGVKNRGAGFHTRSEPNAWWQVELYDEYPIAEVRLFNRLDCCSDRARTVQVLLSRDGNSWTRVFANDGTIFGGVDGDKPLRVPVDGVRARFVRLQLAETNYLHLDEVEVYGRGVNWIEDSAARRATIATGPMDVGPNLALNRPTRQSSVYAGVPADLAGGADGIKNGGLGFHTQSEPTAWWQVDLGTVKSLTEIRVFNRLDCCGERARTIQVLLSNDGSRWETVYINDGRYFWRQGRQAAARVGHGILGPVRPAPTRRDQLPSPGRGGDLLNGKNRRTARRSHSASLPVFLSTAGA